MPDDLYRVLGTSPMGSETLVTSRRHAVLVEQSVMTFVRADDESSRISGRISFVNPYSIGSLP